MKTTPYHLARYIEGKIRFPAKRISYTELLALA